MTIQELLTESAKDNRSPTAKAMAIKLSTRLSPLQCLMLHLCYIGKPINASEYHSVRGRLIKNGYIESYDSGTRGTNYKILKIYKLTTLGITAHGEMLNAFAPMLKRINKQLETI